MTLSIVMPVLNEAAGIASALQALLPLRSRGAEVIVVDGGSTDATIELATPLADRVVVSPRGRAMQMNAGAAVASGGVLLFLHADTRLPEDADALVQAALSGPHLWGRFDVRFADGALPLVAAGMNLRSRLSGIATGDQAMFMIRQALARAGGFPEIALMEDVALSAILKHLSRPACLRARVTTSPRRWHTQGTLRTVLTMWRLRLAFFLGADPTRLARAYGHGGN